MQGLVVYAHATTTINILLLLSGLWNHGKEWVSDLLHYHHQSSSIVHREGSMTFARGVQNLLPLFIINWDDGRLTVFVQVEVEEMGHLLQRQ